MSITFPRPNLLKPKIPGSLAIALLAAQFLLLGPGSNSEPKCELKFERLHVSTYLKEYRNIEALKINIVSECNAPQKKTDLIARIETISNNSQVVVHTFKEASAFPFDKGSTKAIFSNLFVECSSKTPTLYLAKASGRAYLRDGKVIQVRGSSDKFIAVPCRIKAK